MKAVDLATLIPSETQQLPDDDVLLRIPEQGSFRVPTSLGDASKTNKRALNGQQEEARQGQGFQGKYDE